MNGRQSSRTMLLTGCASGIGRHLMHHYLAAGHRVMATDLSADTIDQAASENQQVCALDVQSAEAWELALDKVEAKWGAIDVVMNIAGWLKPGFITETDVADIQQHMRVNVEGTLIGTRAAGRRMSALGRGHIINVGSLASLTPVPGLSLYCASKFAVRGFTLAAAQELAKQGVHVSLLLPDAVDTPMLDLQVDYEEAAVTFSGKAPLTVDDIAQAMDRILQKRPLEVALPLHRATIAKMVGLAPQLAQLAGPIMKKLGERGQKRHRSRDKSS